MQSKVRCTLDTWRWVLLPRTGNMVSQQLPKPCYQHHWGTRYVGVGGGRTENGPWNNPFRSEVLQKKWKFCHWFLWPLDWDFHPLRNTDSVKIETKAARFLIKLSWIDSCTRLDLPATRNSWASQIGPCTCPSFAQVVMTHQGSPGTRKADQHSKSCILSGHRNWFQLPLVS